MTASPQWIVEPSNPPVEIRVRGDGPGNLDFPSTAVSISGSNASVSIQCSNAFANEVDYMAAMGISWEFSIDGETTWHTAGTSENQTYVTLGNPLTTAYHTLLHIGCTNADGTSDAAACTAAIWGEFTDCVVKRVDGVQLTYYNDYRTVNTTTASLLANGDGQCGAWTAFLLDTRKVQGLDQAGDYVQFEPLVDTGFVVNSWNFAGAGKSGIAAYPYLNIPKAQFILANNYDWLFAEVTDAAGVAGQGNANPASLFNNHQVALINGVVYDASYGVTYASEQDIDDVIDGFYTIQQVTISETDISFDLNEDGDTTDTLTGGAFVFRKNPPGLNIGFIVMDY